MGYRRTDITVEGVRQDYLDGLTIDDQMVKYGCSRGVIQERRNEAGLHDVRQPRSRRDETHLARHRHRPMAGPIQSMKAHVGDEARSVFPNTVGLHATVLVSGYNSGKIGSRITKGKWNGFPIFTLTLEERATCPRTCQEWFTCFGNRTSLARRWSAGEEFEERLMRELADLSVKHKGGFAVRLHVLGDFYSTEYVRLWATALEVIPQLHVFGFTARWGDDIGQALRKMADHPRFQIRFSGRAEKMGSVVVSPGESMPQGVIMCPQQQPHPRDPSKTRVATCGQCNFCWASTKPVGFWSH